MFSHALICLPENTTNSRRIHTRSQPNSILNISPRHPTMDYFVEYLSARVDDTVHDLKTSLHEHVDSSVDRKLGQFKRELSSIVRSAVVECIRAQGQNQNWRVETIYTPLSPYQQNLPMEVPSSASHSISFFQGIPPPLVSSDQEVGTVMPTTDQCIADITFPSGHSISIPLHNDSNRSLFEDIAEQQSTQHHLLPSSGSESADSSSLQPDLNINAEQNTSSESAQTINKEQQINNQELLDGSLVTSADQFDSNHSPPLSPSARQSDDYQDDEIDTSDPLNEPNNQSQVVGTNLEHPLNSNIPSDDVNDDNGHGPLEGTEAPLFKVNQPNTGTQSSSIIQNPLPNSTFRTVHQNVITIFSDDDDSEDEGDPSNRESSAIESKRKSVPSNDQSNKKVKHVRQISDESAEDGYNGNMIIYLNCTELGCNDRFKSIDDIRRHLATKHGLLPYQCYALGCNHRGYETGDDLQCHVRDRHNDATEFVCPTCGQSFRSQTTVSHHLYMMHYTGKFQCNIVDECKHVGDTRQEMYLHLQRCKFHRTRAYRAQCDQRSVTFANQAQLNTRFNPFRCTWPDCLVRTYLRGSMVTHIRVKHFRLPVTKKEQIALNIVDARDPTDYFEVVTSQQKD